MKQFFSLVAVALLGSAAWGQTMVTLTVDMTNEMVSADGVHVAGNFQGWDPGATPMTDNMDGTYSHTFTVDSALTIQYKFINGNAWGSEESVPAACGADDGVGGYNRIVAWSSSTGSVMDPVCFGSCETCGDPSDVSPVSLTIRVNMEGLDVDPAGVHVAGTWQAWDPASSPMTPISGSDVWTYTATFNPGSAIRYKFINGNAWGMDESVPSACADGIDRFHVVGSADAMLDPVCYGTCDVCPGPPPAETCPGDLDGDNLLSVNDLLTLLAEFGCFTTCDSDLDGDGAVTVTDILSLLQLFGGACP